MLKAGPKTKIILLLCALMGACRLFSGAALSQTLQPVVVASKVDTEGSLLGNMIALLLSGAGIPVDSGLLKLGPTNVLRTAIIAGQIDVYPEYTGNGATFFGRGLDPVWKRPQSAYETVKHLDAEANNLIWLDRAPANNTWLIAVRGDLAQQRNLRTMADLANLIRGQPQLVKLAASAEFVQSPAALPAFERTYSFRLSREQILILPGGDTASTIRAATQSIGGANAAMVYGTDGALSTLDLRVMEDAQGAQIVYEPAPVVRSTVLMRYPEMGPLLSKAFASLTLARLQDLNAKIAVDGQDPRAVAKSYLEQQGLLR